MSIYNRHLVGLWGVSLSYVSNKDIYCWFTFMPISFQATLSAMQYCEICLSVIQWAFNLTKCTLFYLRYQRQVERHIKYKSFKEGANVLIVERVPNLHLFAQPHTADFKMCRRSFRKVTQNHAIFNGELRNSTQVSSAQDNIIVHFLLQNSNCKGYLALSGPHWWLSDR